MKNLKFFSVLLLALCMTLGVASIAAVADTVGVVDVQRVISSHPGMGDADKKLQSIFQAKDREVKAALAKIKDDPDHKEANKIVQQKRRELAEEEMNLRGPIFREVRTAIRTVARAKNITIVLDSAAVQYGGTDITNDVVAELRKKGGKK